MKKYYKNRNHKSTFYDLLFPLAVILVLSVRYKIYQDVALKVAIIVVLGLMIYLIFKNLNKNIKRKKYIQKTYREIDVMNGEEFELFLKAHFEKKGYFVKTTTKTSDYGVDLICKKGNYKIVIQAKRYKSKVGIAAVQQIIGGMKYYNCDKGIVATNSYFTSVSRLFKKRR